MLLGLHFSVALAGTWTWTGAGTNDNWSTPDNWTPAGPPGSDNATTLIFGGNNRLMPEEDLCDSFLFGSLTFATNAGSFYLTGTTSAFGKTAWRSLQFSGSNTSLNVLGGADITINGALNTPATVAIQTITVASNRVLQVPWIIGGSHRVVVKKGAGLLRVYESDDGQRYLQNSCNVGPEYCIDEGTVEMGTRTDRYVLASDGSGWKAL